MFVELLFIALIREGITDEVRFVFFIFKLLLNYTLMTVYIPRSRGISFSFSFKKFILHRA